MVRPWLNWALDATSVTRSDRPGAPWTWTLPLPSVTRSARDASSSSAATSSIASRASRAAIITALPTRCVARLANVPMSWGPVSVSAVSTYTSSGSTPRVSAAIWPMTVRRPCPRSVADSVTTNRPLVVAWTSACEGSPPRFMPVG